MNYTAMQTLVHNKLEDYGKPVSLRRPATSSLYTKSWDAASGRYKWTLIAEPHTVTFTDPASVPVDVAGHAVEKAYKQEEIDGTTVLAGDRRFMTIDLPTPTTVDQLVVGSSVLTIVSVPKIEPGTVTLCYFLQCRGI
jgi:hypothetical protein